MSIPPRIRLAAIGLAAIILISLSLIFGLRKTVTLRVDGGSRRLTTYALTVGSLLRSQEIHLSASDELTPAQNSWLKNGDQVILLRSIPVQVLVDGELISIYSTSREPSTLLAQSAVEILPGDLLLSNGQPVDPNRLFPENIPAITLQIVRAKVVSLLEAGQSKVLTSTAPTLGSALWAAGYRLFASDQLIPEPSTPLSSGLTASLLPSRPVTIRTQQADTTVRTAAATVGQALSDVNLSLQGLDYSLPAPNSPVPSSGEITLVRVTEEVLIEQTPIPFETEYQPVSDLDLDSQSIVQAGEYGLTAQRLRVRIENGEEITRTVETAWMARQPTPRIIGYGTNVVMHTTAVDGVEIQYWRELSMYATSYHPSEVGDTTASGLPLQKGVAAVDTSLVPFFTELYIPGYGQATAADIGGGVVGRWIDLGYSDSDYVPWHQWVTVYFLWPPPENIVWVLP